MARIYRGYQKAKRKVLYLHFNSTITTKPAPHRTLRTHLYGPFYLKWKNSIVVDRFTGWPCIYVGDSSVDACKMIARLSEDYGIPETISTDGADNYTSQKMESFLRQYGIQHRVSSVANCCAELGVKTMKRSIRDNLSFTGNLDTVKRSRALLQYRNTRDRDIGRSPAEMLMGRQQQREEALAERSAKLKERLGQNTKLLEPLQSGARVVIQNQVGNYCLWTHLAQN